MATTGHCLVCFEALDAELNNRTPLSLDEVLSSYASYRSFASKSEASGSLKDPSILRVANADSASSSSPSSSSSSSLSLAAAASSSTPGTSTSSLPISPPPTSAPLFVTWNTVSQTASDDVEDVALRGCIGTFESQPLDEGLPEYALISALQDTRFAPIAKSELPTLQVAVTLLTNFEEAEDTHDWIIGTHGIRLSFTDNGRRYGSTYLPDVAAEQGWGKDETLFSLVRKAGWMGSRFRWKDLNIKVTKYQGQKVAVNYPEFKKWRDWVSSTQA